MGAALFGLAVTTAIVLALQVLTADADATPRVAIIGGGVGGTAAARFLRQANPSWHIELFERECIGGRTREVTLDGKVLELGASIIHGANQYMLSLAREVNLTLSTQDDTGAAFSIWDGRDFVFSQSGNTLWDFWAVAKRYGVTPLRYKWLSQDAGKRFGGIYKLQQQGKAFATPEQWLKELDIYNATQQSAADYMTDHLSQGFLKYGAGPFIEELAGAINRINYNQNNAQLNALAGLVSYLPAADPDVYSVTEGNAALADKLAEAAQLQGLHVGTAVQTVTMNGHGHYTLTVQPPPPSPAQAGSTDAEHEAQQHPTTAASKEQQQHRQPAGGSAAQDRLQELGPFDAVIIATPLEGSALELKGFDSIPQLPKRTYQHTTTSFVTGHVNAAFFGRATVADGDIFVTSSTKAQFSVVASKGTVSVMAVPQAAMHTPCAAEGQASSYAELPQELPSQSMPQLQQQWRQQQEPTKQIPLWKVFSEQPLSWHTLRTLFVNGTVVASKSWAAYPRFQPPEKFAPFLLSPGLCYNNALENAASAMEVAAVAAKNCALLVQQHVQQLDQQRHLTGAALNMAVV